MRLIGFNKDQKARNLGRHVRKIKRIVFIN